MSFDKSAVITKNYRTFKCLFTAYQNCSCKQEQIELLSEIKINGKRLGNVLSERIYNSIYNSQYPSAEFQLHSLH